MQLLDGECSVSGARVKQQKRETALHGLVAPGKQGPADDGKRLDSLSPAMDVIS